MFSASTNRLPILQNLRPTLLGIAPCPSSLFLFTFFRGLVLHEMAYSCTPVFHTKLTSKIKILERII